MFHSCIDAGITSQFLDSDIVPSVIKQNLCKEVMRNINFNSEVSYSDICNIIEVATSTVVPERGWAQPG